MDKELRKEVRDWKAEVEDRLKRLEDAQVTADAQSAVSEAQEDKVKKTAADPTAEKDAI